MKAEVEGKDGQGKISEVILYDDGRGEDEVGGDGIYSGVFLGRRGGKVGITIRATKGPQTLRSDELKLMLSSLPTQPYWLYGIILLFIGLFIYHRLSLLGFWVEKEGIGKPPRRVELKRVGDVLFLGKREEEPYIDLGLLQYSLLRQKRKEVVLWREGKEEGEIVPWGRWFSPKDEEEIILRFSISMPKRGGTRPGVPRAPQKAEGDFYKW